MASDAFFFLHNFTKNKKALQEKNRYKKRRCVAIVLSSPVAVPFFYPFFSFPTQFRSEKTFAKTNLEKRHKFVCFFQNWRHVTKLFHEVFEKWKKKGFTHWWQPIVTTKALIFESRKTVWNEHKENGKVKYITTICLTSCVFKAK